MKPRLLHPTENVDVSRPLPDNADALVQDLGVTPLLEAMADGDRFLFDVARKVLLQTIDDPQVIVYRQHVLSDCMRHTEPVRELYNIAVESITGEREIFRGLFSERPDALLYRSQEVLELFLRTLQHLRQVADTHADSFRSEGFRTFFAMLDEQLGDDYFALIKDHMRQLRFRGGVLMSAGLAKGNRGCHYVLRRPRQSGPSWLERLPVPNRSGFSFEIAPRDEAGANALAELRDRGVNLVGNALGQATDHILGFFKALRTELAFYLGCCNLHTRLEERRYPLCFPEPAALDTSHLSATALRDAPLTILSDEEVVGNDLAADRKRLIMITGANQGGKSTFLRGLGLAQLMLQSGMFVVAESFGASVCSGIFTHYKREEDTELESGKLDEELSRMSEIAERLTPNAVVLFNESFAATNEREGSEIGRQVVHALLDAGIRVWFVNHLFDLAESLHREQREDALFLRAERAEDRSRTFRLKEGGPLPTSFGEDLYRRIFAETEPSPSQRSPG